MAKKKIKRKLIIGENKKIYYFIEFNTVWYNQSADYRTHLFLTVSSLLRGICHARAFYPDSNDFSLVKVGNYSKPETVWKEGQPDIKLN